MSEPAFFTTCATKIGISSSYWCAAPYLNYTSGASECCGLCSQGAITGDGTIYGTIIGAVFTLLITWFQPNDALNWIAGALLASDCYIVPAYVRVLWGALSQRHHGLQRFHAEFTLIRASSAMATLASAVFMEPCHLHGFTNNKDWEACLAGKLHDDKPHHSWFQRLLNLHGRNAGWITFGFYLAHIIMWTISLPLLKLLGSAGFWQANCQTLVDKNINPLLISASSAFVGVGYILMGLMAWALRTRQSAIYLLGSVLALPVASKRRQFKARIRGGRDDRKAKSLYNTNKYRGQDKGGDMDSLKIHHWLQIAISACLFIFWITLICYIWLHSTSTFLLGYGSWPYACIQNLVLGMTPAISFCFSVIRPLFKSKRKESQKALEEAAAAETARRAGTDAAASRTPAAMNTARTDDPEGPSQMVKEPAEVVPFIKPELREAIGVVYGRHGLIVRGLPSPPPTPRVPASPTPAPRRSSTLPTPRKRRDFV